MIFGIAWARSGPELPGRFQRNAPLRGLAITSLLVALESWLPEWAYQAPVWETFWKLSDSFEVYRYAFYLGVWLLPLTLVLHHTCHRRSPPRPHPTLPAGRQAVVAGLWLVRWVWGLVGLVAYTVHWLGVLVIAGAGEWAAGPPRDTLPPADKWAFLASELLDREATDAQGAVVQRLQRRWHVLGKRLNAFTWPRDFRARFRNATARRRWQPHALHTNPWQGWPNDRPGTLQWNPPV